MRSFNNIITVVFLTITPLACDTLEWPKRESLLVVEGYIDDGGFPLVMLTTTVPVSMEPQHIDSLGDHLLRWAKVTVSDGEQEVVLTGMADRAFFPPFVYTTGRMRGRAGQSYTLRVDYEDYHATAVTTIPQVPTIDSLKVVTTNIDSLYSVSVCLTTNPTTGNYYMTFVRMGRRGKQWLPAYLGLLNYDDVDSQTLEIPVNRPWLVTDTTEYTPFFQKKDSVMVKIAHIDEQAYLFWKDYENNINFARNPLLPYSSNIHSNIEGGIGCWYGCGAVVQPVSFPPKNK